MKKISFKIAAIAVCGLITFASCKKDDATPAATLTGNWTLSEFGADANSNNQVDNGETVPASSANLTGNIEFRGDNTYTASGDTFDNESGTYTYSNNIITTMSTGGDTTALPVTTLTSNRLVVKETSSTPNIFLVLTK